MCGGTAPTQEKQTMRSGLSPRVRGNRSAGDAAHEWWRSIPACAGEPVRGSVLKYAGAVYPRVCGGTQGWPVIPPTRRGLSPRVRGNHGGYQGNPSHQGSIPACAGEPAGRAARRMPGGVYPRVCGGTIVKSVSRAACTGLSPRVRGNPTGNPPPTYPVGSIPACAGEPPDGSAVPE